MNMQYLPCANKTSSIEQPVYVDDNAILQDTETIFDTLSKLPLLSWRHALQLS